MSRRAILKGVDDSRDRRRRLLNRFNLKTEGEEEQDEMKGRRALKGVNID